MSLYLALRHSWVSSQFEYELHCHRKVKHDTDLVWIREVVESFRGIAKREVISSLEEGVSLKGLSEPGSFFCHTIKQTDSLSYLACATMVQSNIIVSCVFKPLLLLK